MSKNKKLIHIHAKCDAFEIWEVVPEKRVVSRLTNIRNNFQYLLRRHKTDKLSVKTAVLNPELPFIPAIV